MALRRGDEGTEVATLQRVLNALGFDVGEADGEFGPRTLDGVIAAQAALGLKQDGIAGPATWDGLDKAFEPSKDNWTSSGVLTDEQVKEAVAQRSSTAVKDHKRLAGVHPVLAQKVVEIIALAEAEGHKVRVSQGLRTFAEQRKLFSKGRTTKGPKVTNARAGFSKHNHGCAADLVFIVDGRASWDVKLYDKIGPWARQVGGLVWGGDFRSIKDRPHLELAGLPSTKKMLATYKAAGSGQKGIKAVWKKYT